jgi:hypothetical protein
LEKSDGALPQFHFSWLLFGGSYTLLQKLLEQGDRERSHFPV